jgi:hypothetical protein
MVVRPVFQETGFQETGFQETVTPLSTGSTWPVTMRDSSEAR